MCDWDGAGGCVFCTVTDPALKRRFSFQSVTAMVIAEISGMR